MSNIRRKRGFQMTHTRRITNMCTKQKQICVKTHTCVTSPKHMCAKFSISYTKSYTLLDKYSHMYKITIYTSNITRMHFSKTTHAL